MDILDKDIKICKYKVDDNCVKWGSSDQFVGRSCKPCLKYRNECYYAAHRDDLLKRSNNKYIPRERPKNYKKKIKPENNE